MLQIAVEEIAKACASSALILMIQELGTLPITLFGSDELKERILPKCATGEWSPAFALSEPEAGSDPASLRTSAVRDGDAWVINGTKNWITNASIADYYVVFAVTDREQRRLSAFVVEADREGVSVPKLEHKLGIKGSPTGSPVFEDVRVPHAKHDRRRGQGPGRRARHAAVHAPGRRGAGRRHRAGSDRLRQPVRQGAHHLRQADQRVPGDRVQARRHGDAHGRRARAALQGVRDGRPPRARLAKYTSMAKLFASDTAMWVTVEAIQVLGGYGYVTEYPVERMMRDAKITQIYEGTNEIQRMVISRAMR